MKLTLDEAKRLMKKNEGTLDISYTNYDELPSGLVIEKNFYARITPIKELPEDIVVKGNIDLSWSDIRKLPDTLISVNGRLDLVGCENLKELTKLKSVKYECDLSSSAVEKLSDELFVGRWLSVTRTNIRCLPNHLKVGGSLYCDDSFIREIPEDIIVGDDLNLSNSNVTKLPNNLIVGGTLDLRNTPIESLPNNLTVGGILFLDYLKLFTPIPDNYKIGFGVRLKRTGVPHYFPKCRLKDKTITDTYVYVDSLLTFYRRVIHKGKYTYYVGVFCGNSVITDGKNFAHCKSFKQGVNDLAFKELKSRGVDQFKNLTIDSVVATDKLINMYRVITGACQVGTEHFVSSLKDLKDSYTVAEAIELTKGHYGAESFKKFFTNDENGE